MTLLAPNGKPSNLTPEQYKLVRTKSFKEWFGDWENEPKNASKVVDENGEPLVVYRTTKKEDYHNDFLKNKYVFGIYFSEDKNSTNIYGKFTKEYFLNIKNPKLLRGIKYDEMWVYSIITKDKYKNLKDNNNDGAIWKRQNVFYELVVFEPNQIKLADGTNTTFDSNNTDIRYKNGGLTMKKTKAKLLAPNGKPSNLTPEQYKLVRTPAFKEWFGDWENDPANSSKVVDENGEPLVVWHTSPNYFNIFDPKKSVKGLFHFGTISQAIDRLTYYIETVGFDLTPYIKLTTEQDEEMFEIDIYWKLVNYILLLNFYDKNDVDVYFENIFNSRQKEFIKNIKINIDKNKIKSEIDKYNIKPYFLRVKKLGKTNDVGENWELDSSFFDGYMYINLHEGNKKEHSFIVFNPNQIKLADGTNTTFDGNNPDIRFEEGGLIDDIFVEDMYSVVIDGDSYHDIIYDGKDYDYALYRYNSIEPDDFVYPNSSHNHKLLRKYFIKYKFVGEIEDGSKISDYIDYLDNSDYWEVIEESEWEELSYDNVAAVNKRTDEIIDEIRDFINSKYVHSRYGSKYMDIYVYDDEDNEIDYITIRVADHSQNPRNRTHEHHISFVIANRNETKDRFRSRDEYYYDDDDDIEGIKSEIESIIDEKIEEIKQERYEQGGILNNLFIYNIGGL